MPDASHRKAPRVDVTLDVFLQTVDGDVPAKTRDASYTGVFIVRNDPLPLRKLIRFRTRLPDSGEELQMLGLVAHTVNAAEARERDRDPGMGIQLFSLGSQTRQKWRDFVDELYERDPQARQTLESSRRPHIEYRLRDDDELDQFRTTDLPRRQLFVHTPELHPPKTDVDCVVVHPDRDETVSLRAVVTESVDGSIKQRGLHLKLELPEETSELEAFLGGPIPDNAPDPHDQPPSEPPPAPAEAPPPTPETPTNEDDGLETDDAEIEEVPETGDEASADGNQDSVDGEQKATAEPDDSNTGDDTDAEDASPSGSDDDSTGDDEDPQ